MKTPLENSLRAHRMEVEDARRVAELNERLGVCEECGKWALRHHAHCSRVGELVDVERQQRCMAYGRGERK